MKRSVFFLFLLFSFCEAYRQEVDDAIRYVSVKSGIDKRIYYSIIDIESNFKPYSISMVAGESVAKAVKKLPKAKYDVKTSKYNKQHLISVFANTEEDIVELAKALYDLDFNIDMGLMQISKQNISADEIEFIFDPKYNIIKGNNVLADCAKKYKSLPQSIECYNRGFKNKTNLRYYQKFAKSFNNNFGDNE